MTSGPKPTGVYRDDRTTRVGSDPGPGDEPGRQPVFPDRYAVLEELGRGGMGTVYRAYDKTLSREVAIKRLHGHLVGPEARQRLAREARAMAQLNHRNVVSVFDVTEIDDDPMVVMEYVPGGTLGQWLERARREPEEILARFLEAGHGLAAAHAAGIVHHDFKPGNVLVSAEGIAKVTDFGLAKPQDTQFDTSDANGPVVDPGASWSSRVTDGNVVMGTPHYMAPEQHAGAPSSPASDQYSFCVALAEAVLGRALFCASDVRALYAAKRQVAATLEEGAMPKRLFTPLRRGLSGKPEQRYPEMLALLADLEPPAPASKRWVVGVAVAAALAGGVTLGSMAFSQDAVEPEPPCSTSESLIEAVWDPERRHAVSSALLEADGEWVDTTSQYVLTAFDRFSVDWADAHRDACEATLVRNEQSDRAMDVRMSCLRQAKTRFSVTLDSIEARGADAASHGPRFVDQLPNLSRCDDAEAIDAAFPEDPVVATQVEAVRDRLAEVAALDDAGEIDAARREIDLLLQQAREIGFDPLIAECLHKKAAVLTTRDGDESMALNYQALELALDSGHQTLGVTAMMGLSFSETKAGEPHTGERLGRIAAALAPPQSATRGMALVNRAAALLEARRGDEAVALLRHAGELLQAVWGPDDPRLAVVVMNTGVAEERRGGYAASYRYFSRADELASGAYGDSHPLVLQIRMAKANALSNMGAVGPATSARLALREATRDTFGHPSRHSMAFDLELGLNFHSARRFDEAEGIYRAVIDFDDQRTAGLHTRASLLLAQLELTRGDEGAIAAARRALQVCDTETCDPASVAVTTMLLHLAQDDPEKAVAEGESWMSSRLRTTGCWTGEARPFITALERAKDPRAARARDTWLECSQSDRAAMAVVD